MRIKNPKKTHEWDYQENISKNKLIFQKLFFLYISVSYPTNWEKNKNTVADSQRKSYFTILNDPLD